MFENFLSEVDYDSSKYTMGYDPKLKDTQTVILIEYVQDLIVEGYSKNYISNCLGRELGWRWNYAFAFVGKCFTKFNKDKDIDAEIVKRKNLRRLTHIYEQAVQSGDNKEAIKAIAEINKMLGLQGQKLEITNNEYELNFGDQQGQ